MALWLTKPLYEGSDKYRHIRFNIKHSTFTNEAIQANFMSHKLFGEQVDRKRKKHYFQHVRCWLMYNIIYIRTVSSQNVHSKCVTKSTVTFTRHGKNMQTGYRDVD